MEGREVGGRSVVGGRRREEKGVSGGKGSTRMNVVGGRMRKGGKGWSKWRKEK